MKKIGLYRVSKWLLNANEFNAKDYMFDSVIVPIRVEKQTKNFVFIKDKKSIDLIKVSKESKDYIFFDSLNQAKLYSIEYMRMKLSYPISYEKINRQRVIKTCMEFNEYLIKEHNKNQNDEINYLEYLTSPISVGSIVKIKDSNDDIHIVKSILVTNDDSKVKIECSVDPLPRCQENPVLFEDLILLFDGRDVLNFIEGKR